MEGFPASAPSMAQRTKLLIATLSRIGDDLAKYEFLMAVLAQDRDLFFATALLHTDTVVPLVYTPTVGRACISYSTLPLPPRGLFISIRNAGRVRDIIAAWPQERVRAIVVTDGERILGLGDLGANGMGIPAGKLALYTALGGVDPSLTLPVTLDVGTNTSSLLSDPDYIGLRHARVTGDAYYAFVDEFIVAARERWGKNLLIQFEDFGSHTAFNLLHKYEDDIVCFNDDIQGTASVVVAGMQTATRVTKKPLRDGVYLFYGAGEAGTGIAELLCYAMAVEETLGEAKPGAAVALSPSALQERAAFFRSRVWLVDSKGLVTAERRASEAMAEHKIPFAHPGPRVSALTDIIAAVRPTALVGVSAHAGAFTKDVVEAMCAISEQPLVLALSNPTHKAECSAEQAYTWSSGRAIFASGSPFDPVRLALPSGDARTLVPGQANNSWIFPAVGMAVLAVDMTRVDDHVMYVAARALADTVSEEDLATGCLYPPLSRIREVSCAVATAVAEDAYSRGIAALSPRPADLKAHVAACMWSPQEA